MLKQVATADEKFASVMIVGAHGALTRQLEGGPCVDVLWSTRSNLANHAVALQNIDELEEDETDGVDQEVMSWLKAEAP